MGGVSTQDHMNAFNKIATLEAQLKQAALSPALLKQLERKVRQEKRNFARDRRHASWPYCGKRHQARINRQIAAGSLRLDNGLDDSNYFNFAERAAERAALVARG